MEEEGGSRLRLVIGDTAFCGFAPGSISLSVDSQHHRPLLHALWCAAAGVTNRGRERLESVSSRSSLVASESSGVAPANALSATRRVAEQENQARPCSANSALHRALHPLPEFRQSSPRPRGLVTFLTTLRTTPQHRPSPIIAYALMPPSVIVAGIDCARQRGLRSIAPSQHDRSTDREWQQGPIEASHGDDEAGGDELRLPRRGALPLTPLPREGVRGLCRVRRAACVE